MSRSGESASRDQGRRKRASISDVARYAPELIERDSVRDLRPLRERIRHVAR